MFWQNANSKISKNILWWILYVNAKIAVDLHVNSNIFANNEDALIIVIFVQNLLVSQTLHLYIALMLACILTSIVNGI